MLDVTDAIGLGPDVIPETVPRVCFADLNNDDWPDLVVNRHRVFLNIPDPNSPIGRRFKETPSNLQPTLPGTATVFADLDNDGKIDAIISEVCQPDDPKWQDHGRRTRWLRGNGDGIFQEEHPLPVPPRPTIAIAVGDLNRDGRLDLFFANSYQAGDTYAGFAGDLLMTDGIAGWRNMTLPDEKIPFNDMSDPGARPTYGAMILSLDGVRPMIYELSYGRRWNRLWVPTTVGRVAAGLQPAHQPSWKNGNLLARVLPHGVRQGGGSISRPETSASNSKEARKMPRNGSLPLGGGQGGGSIATTKPHELTWTDLAPRFRLDGDFIRHGVYPAWLLEIAKTRPQFPTRPEKPFRANGNSFDASIGDVDNDGRFDLLTTEITHAWAGESSDRSRILFQGQNLQFGPRKCYDFDRTDDTTKWNQGDLFGELADMDADGNLDLILSAGDYPDQWLRLYLQRNGKLEEAKDAFPLKHDGSQQISLGDVDGDGAPDLAVGQTFNRLNAEQIAGRKPKMRLFVNRMSTGNHLTLRLKGDGKTVNRYALGAVVKVELPDGTKLQRQLVGIGGHAGKQHDFAVHFGLGKATKAKRLEIVWPNIGRHRQTYQDIAAGTYRIQFGHDGLSAIKPR